MNHSGTTPDGALTSNYLHPSHYHVKSKPSVPVRSVHPATLGTGGQLSHARVAKKPMRPLTAYHIFFQLEREYIIQTIGLEDPHILAKAQNYIEINPDMPRRYHFIRVPRDFYYAPGKRTKRKHRKTHGKIGFLELSRRIAARWAKLDSIDPETKNYVKKLAKLELTQYQKEMQEYKAWIIENSASFCVGKNTSGNPKSGTSISLISTKTGSASRTVQLGQHETSVSTIQRERPMKPLRDIAARRNDDTRFFNRGFQQRSCQNIPPTGTEAKISTTPDNPTGHSLIVRSHQPTMLIDEKFSFDQQVEYFLSCIKAEETRSSNAIIHPDIPLSGGRSANSFLNKPDPRVLPNSENLGYSGCLETRTEIVDDATNLADVNHQQRKESEKAQQDYFTFYPVDIQDDDLRDIWRN